MKISFLLPHLCFSPLFDFDDNLFASLQIKRLLFPFSDHDNENACSFNDLKNATKI